METAGVVAAVLLAVVALFQISLALGAPLGGAAWGGQHAGVLPGRLRLASGVAAVVLYPLIVVFVLTSAGMITADWLPFIGPVAMWVLTGFFAVGAVANFVSRSPIERIWGPVSLGIAGCCGVIAAGM